VLGVGDIHFRLDHADFRSGAGTTESEFYIEIDNHELVFAPRGAGMQAEVELRLEFFRRGRKLDSKSYPLEIQAQPAGQTTSRPAQVLQLRVPAQAEATRCTPGWKTGTPAARPLPHVHPDPQIGERGLARPPALPGRRALGLRSRVPPAVGARAGGHLRQSGMDVEPHPGRVYGAPAAGGHLPRGLRPPAGGKMQGARRRRATTELSTRSATSGKAFRSWTELWPAAAPPGPTPPASR
jgi:hypothetical protein